MTDQNYQKCIDACIECATSCNHCAISCLEEKDVKYLTKCIRLNLECAVICRATAELMNLGSDYSPQLSDLCATICNACAEMCEQHANMGMEHCRECAEACRAFTKELMAVSENLKQQDGVAKTTDVHQDECAIFSRASSELMSLDSTYFQDICALTATVCGEAAKSFETNSNMEMEHNRHRALISNEAQEHLKNQEQPIEDEKITDQKKEQSPQQKEAVKTKNKHSTALLAASMWRSPVHHARRHSSGGLYGNYATTGTNVSYDEEDI